MPSRPFRLAALLIAASAVSAGCSREQFDVIFDDGRSRHPVEYTESDVDLREESLGAENTAADVRQDPVGTDENPFRGDRPYLEDERRTEARQRLENRNIWFNI